mgnify:CR=1 FL=1
MADNINIVITEDAVNVTVTGGATWDSLTGKPAAVAESSFMVSGPTPFAWLVKTLAQVKTILGLTDYVAHSLATAANDFIVSSGAGVFVKKTFAEVRLMLESYFSLIGHTHVETSVVPAGFYTIVHASPISIDLALSRDFKVEYITGTTTINLTGINDGRAGVIVLVVDGTGGYTISPGTGFSFALNATALSGVANKKNVISYICYGNSDVFYSINVV